MIQNGFSFLGSMSVKQQIDAKNVVEIAQRGGFVKITINGKETTYRGKEGEVREGKTFIDGVEATDSDPRIVPESAAIPPETLRMAENFKSRGFNCKVDLLGNIKFLPKSSTPKMHATNQGKTPRRKP
jgi:hypothetical protein